jgi:cysteinyl-tRNA synthetase
MSEEEKDQLYRNLIILLKMFKNRPYHLAKYLTENSAFNQNFIKKILESDKLKNLVKEEDESALQTNFIPIHFNDINQMNEFYGSIIDDKLLSSEEKSIEELTKELNEKLDTCIKGENYEDAARVRDYMSRNGIKRNK